MWRKRIAILTFCHLLCSYFCNMFHSRLISSESFISFSTTLQFLNLILYCIFWDYLFRSRYQQRKSKLSSFVLFSLFVYSEMILNLQFVVKTIIFYNMIFSLDQIQIYTMSHINMFLVKMDDGTLPVQF